MTIIDKTLGAELLGALGSTLLFGVTLVQIYNWVVLGYQDQLKMKLLVTWVG
jgi:hypothetical protein